MRSERGCMSFSGFIVQLLNGLASASSLFLVAAGLSLIFGVTRIVNFAHGSFFMVGIYVAYTLVERLGTGLGFWPALLLAALAVGVLGALIEMVLLRRIYKAPELFQLLATFALVLVIKDAVLWLWGPDELLGPARAGPVGLGRDPRPPVPGLRPVPDRRRPGGARPGVAAAHAHALRHAGARRHARPRDGQRARRQPGLAVHRGVRARRPARRPGRRAAAAARAGHARDGPATPSAPPSSWWWSAAWARSPAPTSAALLIAEIKAVCIWLGVVDVFGISVSFSKLTLVVDFLVMAVVLVVRPVGPVRPAAGAEPLRRACRRSRCACRRATALLAAAALVLGCWRCCRC